MSNKKTVILSTDQPLWDDFCTEYIPPACEGINKDFLKSIEDGYIQFINNDFNSTGKKKQSVQHDFIRNILEQYLPDRFKIYSKTENQLVKEEYGKEYTVPMCGSFAGKKIDITIYDEKRNKPVVIINCKFPLSSYTKNIPNYKTDFYGESGLLRAKNPDVGIFYCNVLMYQTPRFKTNGEQRVLDGFDIVKDRRVEEYDQVVELGKIEGRINEYFFCLLDDSITKEMWVESYENLKKYHNTENYHLKYKESSKTFNNLIYNDFELFINKILDCVKEYEKTH